jgi:hypothetical protein
MVRELIATVVEEAVMGYLLLLFPPTAPMVQAAKSMGLYKNDLFGFEKYKINIITIEELLSGNRLPISKNISISVLTQAKYKGRNLSENGFLPNVDEQLAIF